MIWGITKDEGNTNAKKRLSHSRHEFSYRYLLDPRFSQLPLDLRFLSDHLSLKDISPFFIFLFCLICEVLRVISKGTDLVS